MTAVVPPQLGAAVVPGLQRRAVRTLFVSQVCGGIGVGTAAGVGSLLVADLSGSAALAGLAGTATTFGGAIAAFPMAAAMAKRGRRIGLTGGYVVGLAGAVLVCCGAVLRSLPLVLVAMLLFGAANGTNLQARYAATDLADPSRRGRSIALVIWATTLGAVAGPNLLEPSSAIGRQVGLPQLAGPFAWSALAFVLAIVVLQVGLRPDPLLERYRLLGERPTVHVRGPIRLLTSLRHIVRSRVALVGLIAMVAGQISMTGVMSMTPIHMRDTAMGSLHVIGLVISLHIAGMYALSPLVGWFADRVGNLRALVVGPVVLWLSAVCAGFAAGDAIVQLSLGLFLLGLGWSVCLVAGSSMLSAALPEEVRTEAQGAADLTMGVLGALGGALAGVVQDLFGYARLNLATSMLLVVAVAAAALLLSRQSADADSAALSSASSLR